MVGAVRDQVVFLLNGELHEVPRCVPPTRTLLEYLREDLGLKGTKEGCNEGDCGACTVVVAERDGAKAVNACILFVPMLDGKSVTTVEGLAGPNGELHPCQQAMVDCHGSQCGFCTPGFVMSLYAMYQSGESCDRSGINDSLAGNLCRCTGYGPIISAAERMRERPEPEWRVPSPLGDPGELSQFHPDDRRLALIHPKSSFLSPTTLDELVELSAQHPEAIYLGGATDVGLWANKRLQDLPVLISTSQVKELHKRGAVPDRDPNVLYIGSAVAYSTAYADLDFYYPSVGELISRLGSEQVRNSGTIGGNIANGSPIGDMPPALISLGSTLILNGPEGQRRLPLEDFFLAYGKQDRKPGEFVEAVEVPIAKLDMPPADHRLRCYKISKRFDQDISAVLGCFYLHIDNGAVISARIAFGGMAGIPKRAKAVEAALAGKPWTMTTVEAALPKFDVDFQPLSDARASREYRMQTAKNLLVRYFHETTSDVQTRLVGKDERITAEVVG